MCAASFHTKARVAAVRIANADKIVITSLPYQVSGSTAGAQSLLGSMRGNGAVLYSLQCPADAAVTVVVLMVRYAAAAGCLGATLTALAAAAAAGRGRCLHLATLLHLLDVVGQRERQSGR